MQTFLPYPDFKESAKVLDRQRLGKQRVEVWQILRTLEVGSRWDRHPAVRMWQGHSQALAHYGLAICREWVSRGYRDTMSYRIAGYINFRRNQTYPKWLGDNAFHASHRSNLLRKNPEWYGRFGWSEEPDLPYVWPT